MSGKLLDCEYFLITVLFVKTKEIPVKKITFFLGSRFFGFLAENLLRSRRARVDQNGEKKTVIFMKNLIFGVYYTLKFQGKGKEVMAISLMRNLFVSILFLSLKQRLDIRKVLKHPLTQIPLSLLSLLV